MILDVISAGGLGLKAIRTQVVVDQVIIRDIHGNPLAVAFQNGDVTIVAKGGKNGDADFPSILKRLGEKPAEFVTISRK